MTMGYGLEYGARKFKIKRANHPLGFFLNFFILTLQYVPLHFRRRFGVQTESRS